MHNRFSTLLESVNENKNKSNTLAYISIIRDISKRIMYKSTLFKKNYGKLCNIYGNIIAIVTKQIYLLTQIIFHVRM